MKNIFLSLALVMLIIGCRQEKNKNYTNKIEQFQYKMNVEFSDKKTTPLKNEDFKSFKKLHFFPINKSFRVIAKFERTPNESIFEMPTTTERKPLYTQYGIATFSIEGEDLSLRIYQNQKLILDTEYKDYLFIPFNDETNGNETYDGGRYIDLEKPIGETITIDFNKAYNPYCAYNEDYSCPIPPRENYLPIQIEAGVLSFGKTKQ
ncbi:MAG: DUF1684 domain-containing protein [Flavobacteriaceae bacterium]|nr:DUF1684 domain-containing protein [Flavobacteriaceae bacterium]